MQEEQSEVLQSSSAFWKSVWFYSPKMGKKNILQNKALRNTHVKPQLVPDLIVSLNGANGRALRVNLEQNFSSLM